MDEKKKQIEESRVNFLNYFKKIRIINWAIFALMILVFILDFVLLKDKMTIALIVSIVLIVAAFVYLKIVRSKINSRTRKYINDFYALIDDIEIAAINVNDFTSLAEDTFTIEDIKNAQFMKDLVSCKSKNTVQFDMYEKTIQMADLMFSVTNPKDAQKPIVAFCGKFIQYHSNKNYDDRIVLYRKTTIENCYGPTDVEGLEKVIDNDKLLVYATSKNYNKIFNSNLISKIESIEVNDYLYDFTITINGNLVTIALSYADKLVAVPLQEPTDFASYDQIINDLKFVSEEIIKTI